MPLKRIAAGQYRIEGEMTVYEAETLKAPLLAILKDSSSLEIDLSGIEELDTAGLQLLLLLKNEAQLQNRKIRFSRHSSTVREILDLCDLAAIFGDPILICKSAGEN
ncbi:STAS domain-containing protein [Gammaproteobacteria bacterium]